MELNREGISYSVSVISTSPRSFFDALPTLETLGVDRIHVDVMDGDFVPRFGLYPEFVTEVRERTGLPIDVHMMVRNPENFVQVFANAGATRIVPHVEPVEHLNRLIMTILDSGLEAGLAFNPHSDVTSATYILELLSGVTLMAINPGIVGHKAIPLIEKKISDVSGLLAQRGFEGDLEVDGGVVFENVPSFSRAGANLLVIGAGTVFSQSQPLEKNMSVLNKLRGANV